MENSTKTLGHRFAESQDNFYNGIWAFILFAGSIVLFAIIQMILFIFTDFKVIGSSDVNHWQSWVYMIIAPLGSALSLVGYIYSVRVDKRFFWPTIIGQFIMLLTSFLGGLVWTGMVMFFAIAASIVRVIIVNKLGTEYSLNFKLIEIVSVTSILAVSTIGIIFACYEPIGGVLWYIEKPTWYRILDVITAGLAMLGIMLLMTKNRNAFIVFMGCNVIFIGLFIVTQMWLNALQLLIFLIANICSTAAWTYKKKHSEDFSRDESTLIDEQ